MGLTTAAYAQAPVSQSQVYFSMDDTDVNYGVNHLPQLGGPPSYVSVNRNPLVPPPIAPIAPIAPVAPIVDPIRPPFYGDLSPYGVAPFTGPAVNPFLRPGVAPYSSFYGNSPYSSVYGNNRYLGSPYNANLYGGLVPSTGYSLNRVNPAVGLNPYGRYY